MLVSCYTMFNACSTAMQGAIRSRRTQSRKPQPPTPGPTHFEAPNSADRSWMLTRVRHLMIPSTYRSLPETPCLS